MESPDTTSDQPGVGAVGELAERLSNGLYELADIAGRIAEVVRSEGEHVLDNDARLALDQSRSNAQAIARMLDRLGLG